MKNNKIHEKELSSILKETGLVKPSEQFSDRLKHVVMHEYKVTRAEEYTAGRWLGKLVLSILVIFNIVVLYRLNPFSVQPVLFVAFSAFIFGLWVLIGILKRSWRMFSK